MEGVPSDEPGHAEFRFVSRIASTTWRASLGGLGPAGALTMH